MTSSITIDLTQERETKNMILFVAHPDSDIARKANVPNLYVRKTALAAAFNGFPQKLRITLEEGAK